MKNAWVFSVGVDSEIMTNEKRMLQPTSVLKERMDVEGTSWYPEHPFCFGSFSWVMNQIST